MATVESSSVVSPGMTANTGVPELCAGDQLTRAEFERRYSAMPNVKKAELIEGEVYMPSPVSRRHAGPQAKIITWLGYYWSATPGVESCDNATVRLDLENEPQPDGFLRVLPQCGGQSWDEDEYVGGAPELFAEIAVSSASIDLHKKLRVYQRNGVREYLVWRVSDSAIDWFGLREGRFERLPPGETGRFRSEVFPGLWLDPAAMLRGDLAGVMAVLQEGIASPEHAAFVAKLEAASVREGAQ
jgi:Uma2 family endonuclease